MVTWPFTIYVGIWLSWNCQASGADSASWPSVPEVMSAYDWVFIRVSPPLVAIVWNRTCMSVVCSPWASGQLRARWQIRISTWMQHSGAAKLSSWNFLKSINQFRRLAHQNVVSYLHHFERRFYECASLVTPCFTPRLSVRFGIY